MSCKLGCKFSSIATQCRLLAPIRKAVLTCWNAENIRKCVHMTAGAFDLHGVNVKEMMHEYRTLLSPTIIIGSRPFQSL